MLVDVVPALVTMEIGRYIWILDYFYQCIYIIMYM